VKIGKYLQNFFHALLILGIIAELHAQSASIMCHSRSGTCLSHVTVTHFQYPI